MLFHVLKRLKIMKAEKRMKYEISLCRVAICTSCSSKAFTMYPPTPFMPPHLYCTSPLRWRIKAMGKQTDLQVIPEHSNHLHIRNRNIMNSWQSSQELLTRILIPHEAVQKLRLQNSNTLQLDSWDDTAIKGIYRLYTHQYQVCASGVHLPSDTIQTVDLLLFSRGGELLLKDCQNETSNFCWKTASQLHR